MAKHELGKNLSITVEGNKLTIEIDLAQDNGLSKSQKSKVIATSAGSISIPDRPGILLNLNLNEKV